MGREGSATRLVSRIFSRSGCYSGATDHEHSDYKLRTWLSEKSGRDSFSQFFKGVVPHNIVYRTHPTPNYYPHMASIVDKMRDVGYEVWWIVIIRRPRRWLNTIPNCKPNDIWQNYGDIFKFALPEEQIVFLDTSLLFLDSKRYLQELSEVIGLPMQCAPEKILNADERHFV